MGYRAFWLLDGFNGDPGVAQIPVVALVAMSAIFNIEHTGIVEYVTGKILQSEREGMLVPLAFVRNKTYKSSSLVIICVVIVRLEPDGQEDVSRTKCEI